MEKNDTKEIRVVYKLPGQPAEERVIKDELEEYQKLVDGCIETIPASIAGDVLAIVNDYGKFNGMKRNIRIGNNLIFGPVIFVGVDEEDFADCPVSAETINEAFFREDV